MIEDRDSHRLRKQAERDRRLDGIYRQNPALRALDDALAAAGREGLMRAWGRASAVDVKRKMTDILEQKEQLLRELGLDEGIYEADWDCPLCQDRGYVRPGEPCSCRRLDDGDRRLVESSLSALQRKQTFTNFSFDWYDNPEEVRKLAGQVERFVRDLIAGEPCGNLFLFGPVGNGKTHLCSAAANMALAAGKTVIYARTEELLDALREDIYGRGGAADRWESPASGDRQENEEWQAATPYARSQLQGRLVRADLLILEDLGTENLTDFAEEQLVRLIDSRINWQKPWIITSHLIGEKFNGHYDPMLVDRVLGEGKRLYLNEGSIRLKRALKQRSGT